MRPLVFAICALVLAACTGGAISTGPAPSGPETSDPAPAGTPAEVLRVTDGDSLDVRLDGATAEVRLLGINAPERAECHGPEAGAALERLVGGVTVGLVADPAVDTDQYGRLLRYVWVGEQLINLELVRAGHALALQIEFDRRAAFTQAETDAFAARLGMWAPAACGPAPPDGISIIAVEYDPRGRDAENLEDEYVRIANTGAADVSLGGWTLRDESTTHRFVFPDVSLPPGGEMVVTSGCGSAGGDGATLHWCAGTPVWSNAGDTALLQDSAGNVVSRWSYPGG